jgi:glyoxylase-like metal-dependent hydrolase (beta-lactamase superfamily II)
VPDVPWQEIGDRVFTRRFAFYDQQIGVVLGSREVLLVDTRSTPAQAREIVAELRSLTRQPVSIVVDTHWHYDHSFGNSVFRPAAIWGHVRTAERLRRDGASAAREVAVEVPELASGLAELQIDPPERTFEEAATVDLGDRLVELTYHGRGHTDGDIAIHVPDAGVLFVGDLLEEGAPPSFGDSFPLDWPGTVRRLLPLMTGAVVPGHGAVVDRGFAAAQLADLERLAELGRRVHRAELELEAAAAAAPFAGVAAREGLERALLQLRGDAPAVLGGDT